MLRKEHGLTLAAGGLLGLALYVAGPAKGTSAVVWREAHKHGIPLGAKAEDFELRTAEGVTISLGDLKGSRVGLIFVTASCPYCGQLQEALEGLELQPDQELLVVCGTDEEAEEIRSSYSHPYAVLVDPGRRAQTAYKALGVPTVYVLDEGRRVAGVYKGWPSSWENLQKWSQEPCGPDCVSEDGA